MVAQVLASGISTALLNPEGGKGRRCQTDHVSGTGADWCVRVAFLLAALLMAAPTHPPAKILQFGSIGAGEDVIPMMDAGTRADVPPSRVA
jgi:hypothetical protein